MEHNSPQGGCSAPRKSKFDADLAWRFAVAFVGTAVATVLIASIVSAPIGIPLLLASCKPLKDYFVRRANEAAARQQVLQVTVRVKRRK
jgi:hypothetical protein